MEMAVFLKKQIINQTNNQQKKPDISQLAEKQMHIAERTI